MTTQPPNKSQPRKVIAIRARIAEWKPEAFSRDELYEDCQTLLTTVEILQSALEALQAEHLKDHDDLINRLEHSYHFCRGVERERDELQTKLEKAKAALESILTCESALGAPAHIDGIRKIARQALADLNQADKGDQS